MDQDLTSADYYYLRVMVKGCDKYNVQNTIYQIDYQLINNFNHF